MAIKELFTPDFAITWLPWAVQYFFLIALTYAAVWIVCTEIFINKSKNTRLLTLGGILMLSAGIVAPISLLADLHQPARAWHFYTQLRLSSWMWFGAYLLPIFITSTLSLGWLLLREHFVKQSQGTDLWAKFCNLLRLGKWKSAKFIKPVAIISFISSLSIAFYTGMEIMVVKARVLWHTPLLPVVLVFTAIFSAAGTLLVLNYFIRGYKQNTSNQLLKWCTWSAKLFLLTAAVWVLVGDSSVEEAMRLLEFSATWQLSAIWIAFTIVVFVVLLAKAKNNKIALLLTGLTAIHLAWGIRWIILIQSQISPKYGAGTYFYELPWGPDGMLGILGTFSLWFAIILILSEVVRDTSLSNKPTMVKGS